MTQPEILYTVIQALIGGGNVKYEIEEENGVCKKIVIEKDGKRIELSLSEALEMNEFIKKITKDKERPIYIPYPVRVPDTIRYPTYTQPEWIDTQPDWTCSDSNKVNDTYISYRDYKQVEKIHSGD